MTMGKEGYGKMMASIYRNQQKIILQNDYIIQMLEAMHDDSLNVSELQRRNREAMAELREMKYQQWFEKNTKP